MSFRIYRRLLATVLAWVSLNPAAVASSYTILDLGTGVARDINAAGKIVGDTEGSAWHFDGVARSTIRFGAHFLGGPADQPLYFTALSANSINNRGQIVGSVMFIPRQWSSQTAYLFEGGDAATLLTNGDAFGVNSSGTVVGAGESGFFLGSSGFVTVPGASPRLLAVNDADVSAGSVQRAGAEVAAVFHGNSFTVLDLAPLNLPVASPADHYESTGRSINNAGQIVGTVRLVSHDGTVSREWGFLHANDAATALGNLGGSRTSAHDINNTGVIVGAATASDGTDHAFVKMNGAVADLNALVVGAYGWLLRSANAVNDDGLIVGEGMKDGQQHAYLLRPTANSFPPVITLPPAGVVVLAGEPFQLGVIAFGTPPLSYQWRHAGTNLPGATESTFVVPTANATEGGSYQVVVTNPFGQSTSDDALVNVVPKEAVMPSLSVGMYAGITIEGTIGQRVQILALEDPKDTTWQPLTTVTLTTIPLLWIDPASTQRSHRLYRAVLVP